MKLIVNKKNDYCESVTIEYTPLEALIINEAMRRYVDDEEMRADDRKIMEHMLEVKPIVREIMTESDKHGMTREEAHRILSAGLANAPSEHDWCTAFEMAVKYVLADEIDKQRKEEPNA